MDPAPPPERKELTMNEKQVCIRIATPSDSEKLRAMFARSSSETIYLRFHIPFPEVPERMPTLMLDAGDRHDQEALVAVAEGEVVGHTMYARLGEDGEAEMAIIVEDGWQSKGVGKSLLCRLAESARLRGIETFTAEVLGQNRRMLGLAAMFAGTSHTIEDGVYQVRMPLRAPEPAPHVARALHRAA